MCSSDLAKIDRELRTTEKPEPVVDPNEGVFQDWVKKNEWYEKDDFLGVEADLLAQQYARQGVPLGDALGKIEVHLKRKYPESFENTQRKAAPTVEGGGNPAPRSSKMKSEKDLTPEESTVLKKFERNGMFKDDKDGSAKAAYIKDVIKIRD